MSAVPADVLRELESFHEERRTRFARMLETVAKHFANMDPPKVTLWEFDFRRLHEAAERTRTRSISFDEVESVVRSLYQRVLIEEGPEIHVPETADEWDALPDLLPEFKRRHNIPE